MIHELKIETDYFISVLDGSKNFEVRLNDRDFNSGDSLLMKEYLQCWNCSGKGCHPSRDDPENNRLVICATCKGRGGSYTGRYVTRVVKRVFSLLLGIKDGYVAMSFVE